MYITRQKTTLSVYKYLMILFLIDFILERERKKKAVWQ